MPIYEFVCTVCEDKTPMAYKMKISEWDVQEVICRICGAKATKTPSVTTFELKGSGWFSSGYTKSGS